MSLLIVANWKLNKTVSEAIKWLDEFKTHNSSFVIHNSVDVVICPSFVVIPELKRELGKAGPPIKLGAQDVSQFEKGQYTGEVSAGMLKGLVDYVIVGHSERRRYFEETEEMVAQKLERCQKHKLTPILCISELEQIQGCEKVKDLVIAYEPLEAISTEGEFHPDDPDHTNEIAEKIKAIAGSNIRVLYGGSAHEKNAKSFVEKKNIDGLLVGQASLDAKQFAEIVQEVAELPR